MCDYCTTENLPIIGFSPLAKGGLVNPAKLQEQYHGPDTEARLTALRAVADELGATPNQVALAWIARHPAPIIPLFSASRLEQATENLGAVDLEIPSALMTRLDEARG